MRPVLLAGAALAVLAATGAQAQPLPQPGGGTIQPQTFEQQMQAANNQRAERDASDRAQLQRDLARMTPEAQQTYREYGERRVSEVIGAHDLSRTGSEMRRDVERGLQNLEQYSLGEGAFNPGTAGNMTDRAFGEFGAHGVVNGGSAMIQTQRDVLRTARPLVTDLVQAGADIAVERERLILQSNPNMSQAARDRLRYETQQSQHAAQNINTRLNEADFHLRTQEQNVREAEDRIADRMTEMAQQQGHDLTQWQMPAGGTTQTPGSAARPPGQSYPVPPRTAPQIQPPASPTPSPPSPPSSPSSGGRLSGQPGTIPGQGGDPYAGLRVQSSQGSSGATTPRSNAAAQASARQQQQAQAERNAARTEQLRQQAMDQARADNEEIDAHSGAMHAASNATNDILQAEGEAESQYNNMLDSLRRSVRPGQVGRGGGSSGGYGNGGGSYDDQMASGDGFPADGTMNSIVEWRGRQPVDPADDGSFGSLDAFDEMARATAGMSAADFYDTWQSFELGGTIIVADLVPIYDGYDLDNAPPGSSGRSLSSAGTSLSSAGTSLSSAGTSLSSAGSITPSSAPIGMRVDWGGYNLSADPLRVANGGRPEPGSYADMLAQLNGPRPSLLNTNPWSDTPWAQSNRDLANLLYGPLWSDRPYQIQHDYLGRNGRAMSDYEVANLFDTDLDIYLRLLGSDFDWLRVLLAGDRSGLDRLLAQPFNVLLTWGANAHDLDLHMTGPLETAADRFHIYYSATGTLTAQPFAQLIKDCICNSGSEVILTSALNRGSGVYRVSVFNFGDQSAASLNLANQSQASLQIVRGGTAVSVGDGTTIQGGQTLLTVDVPSSQPGNTWVAAEINPTNGTISAPNIIVQSGSSESVR